MASQRNRTQQTGISYVSHTSRPPKKIQALQMGVTPVPWGGDQLVGEALLAVPLNWDDGVNSVGYCLTPHYCPASNDDCGSGGADDLMIPHDDFC